MIDENYISFKIQYRHTPEIFRKRREIKEALLDALEKKKTNRHSSVSDSEQKGQSPFLPPVDTAAANIHALNGDDNMLTSADCKNSSR